ncbi:MAG: SUF system NifU family Fe-S cluster assembly protein [Nitrospinae bacterium]|nr:SUF system NifU family Fe-S cluster assembly protein [Nitrospinota bacterium]
MSYKSDLYQQVILEHNRKPRNFRVIEGGSASCDGHNPLCGDKLTVYVKVNPEEIIEDISFQGSGCAISKSSASMMTAFLKGRTVPESRIIFDEFHRMIVGEFDPESPQSHLGRLAIFSGVREYPSRTKCATLAWHAMICAVDEMDIFRING